MFEPIWALSMGAGWACEGMRWRKTRRMLGGCAWMHSGQTKGEVGADRRILWARKKNTGDGSASMRLESTSSRYHLLCRGRRAEDERQDTWDRAEYSKMCTFFRHHQGQGFKVLLDC